MKNNTKVLLLVLISLCSGLVIYATTRTEKLFLNKSLFPFLPIKIIRDFISHIHIPQWIIYSLPDALWMLAFMLVILMIWNFRLNRKSLPWVIIALLAGLFFEIGQGFHFVQGTFDPKDLIGLFIGASIPIFYSLNKLRVCKIK